MDEDEPPTALGSFVYDIKGEIAQTFHVQVWPVLARKAWPAQPGPALLSLPRGTQTRRPSHLWQPWFFLLEHSSPQAPPASPLPSRSSPPSLRRWLAALGAAMAAREPPQQQEGAAGGKPSPCGCGGTTAGGREEGGCLPPSAAPSHGSGAEPGFGQGSRA